MVNLPVMRRLGYPAALAGVVLATVARLALNPMVGPRLSFRDGFSCPAADGLDMRYRSSSTGPGTRFPGGSIFHNPAVRLFRAHGAGRSYWIVAFSPAGGAGNRRRRGGARNRRRLEEEIADRKQAEERLLKSEARLHLALEAGSSRELGVGDLFRSVLLVRQPGSHPRPCCWAVRGDVRGLPEAHPPDDREAVLRSISRSVESVGTYEIQFRNLRADGAIGWISGRGRVLPDERGRAARIIAVASDITERKRLSEQLESERNLLDALFAASPVGLGLVDAGFRFRRINQAVAETNGLPQEAHIGRTIAEVLPDLWPTLEPLYRRVLESGEPVRNLEVEGETSKSPGYRQNWLVNYYPVRLGGSVIGVGFTIVETTEARRREARLRETEKRLWDRAKVLETVLAATPAAIFITHDRECRDITGNRAAYKLLKSPEGSVISASAHAELLKDRSMREYRNGEPVSAPGPADASGSQRWYRGERRRAGLRIRRRRRARTYTATPYRCGTTVVRLSGRSPLSWTLPG